MKLLKRCVTPLVLLSLVPANAKAQTWISGEDFGLTSKMCLLRADGTGQFDLTLDSLVVAVLTTALPDLFSVVEAQETCDDGRDNNCNGEIDEDCSAANIWDAGADCDACMQELCSVFSKRCDGDTACEDAVSCVLDAKCLDRDIGPISCFCGEDVSIEACQDSPISELDGACMGQFAKNVIPSWIPAPETGGVLAGKMFLCMTRQCADSCSENIYNYEADQ